MMTIGTTVKGGGQRDIAGGALLRIDGLADEQSRRADDLRNDVIAKRQRKGEDRTGDDAGKGQRKQHVAKRLLRVPPRSDEASIRLPGTRSSAAWIGRIMNGIQT
jgi:hypothetical protein